jgi:hypothetical protein
MMMTTDSHTLHVALDGVLQAMGKLHMDDEDTLGYKNGKSVSMPPSPLTLVVVACSSNP